ncbi:MAG: hypothetical protein RQ745_07745 [Longimicrobiales bacterium]|nr:hypothetical protein [Longimicrobiales bacterium]
MGEATGTGAAESGVGPRGNASSPSPASGGIWGPVGSIFAALCCLGFAPLLGALGAVGLGFVVNDVILIPLLVLFLGATIGALRHDEARRAPRVVSTLGAAVTLGGLWVSGIVVGAGLALVVASSIWNATLVRRARA